MASSAALLHISLLAKVTLITDCCVLPYNTLTCIYLSNFVLTNSRLGGIEETLGTSIECRIFLTDIIWQPNFAPFPNLYFSTFSCKKSFSNVAAHPLTVSLENIEFSNILQPPLCYTSLESLAQMCHFNENISKSYDFSHLTNQKKDDVSSERK